jgi:8-amino-7-oxononanoate synthase
MTEMKPRPASHITRSPISESQTALARRLEVQLQQRMELHQFRERRPVRIIDSTHLEIAGRRCVNFASNNYLGLTHHPKLISLLRSSPDGVGSGAAALVSGYTEAHAAAEAKIAEWKSTESAVLLPSGYQANLAAIQTFAALKGEGIESDRKGVRFLLDKLVHASLIDAVRNSGLPFRIFPHNHLAKLERLLSGSDDSQLQIVITESIFSMDGDAADVAGLAELKKRYPFALMVDEAHACGVYGNGGAGLLAESGYAQIADVIVCTFSKAAGLIGGAVCASRRFTDGLVNFGRAYIYSTAVPPWVANAAAAAVDIMRVESQRQQRVRSLAIEVRKRLNSAGFNIPPGDSPIIPVILGDEEATTSSAATLLSAGLFVTAIRPPTVMRGTSRLRCTLSCDHTDAEIENLIELMQSIIKPTIK